MRRHRRGDGVGGLGQRKAGRSEREKENLRHALLHLRPDSRGGETTKGPRAGHR